MEELAAHNKNLLFDCHCTNLAAATLARFRPARFRLARSASTIYFESDSSPTVKACQNTYIFLLRFTTEYESDRFKHIQSKINLCTGKIHGKRLTSDTLFAIKTKSLTGKCFTYTIYSKDRQRRTETGYSTTET